MATIYFHPSNCGMRDLVLGYGNTNPEATMLEVCRACIDAKFVSGKRVDKFAPIAAHVVFSQACTPKDKKNGYGQLFMNFIVENKLGTVIKTEPILNPDHGPNYITAFLWSPDAKAMEKWYEKNKPKEKTPAPAIGSPNYDYGVKRPMYCPGLPHEVKDNKPIPMP